MKILGTDAPPKPAPAPIVEVDAAWRWLGWFGLALALLGLGDVLLAWIPLVFSSWQWEFGTVASTIAGLPLTTIGIAGLYGSLLARRQRRPLLAASIVITLFGALIIVLLVLFVLDIPLALDTAQGPQALAVKKVIAKTLLLGIGFCLIYLAAGIAGLRAARRPA